MLVNAVTGTGGLLGIMIPVWVVMAMVALCGPNATALALAEHGQRAGAAAALLGAAQFAVGAAIAPLTGLGEAGSAVPMAATIAGALFLAAVLIRLVLTAGSCRRHRLSSRWMSSPPRSREPKPGLRPRPAGAIHSQMGTPQSVVSDERAA